MSTPRRSGTAPCARRSTRTAPSSSGRSRITRKNGWGHGYATEGAIASIAYGFDELELELIVAVAVETNLASRRVLEKCGLSEVGLVHVYGLENVKYEIRR